jgi:hypothetical protein
MIETLPDLAAVRAFAVRLPHLSWFAACGEALTVGEIADAEAWTRALGLAVAGVERVASLGDAAAVAKRPDWSRAWWEAEEQARRALYAAASASGEERLLEALSAVIESAGDTLHGAASVAIARAGVADPALARVAAGAAAEAAYQAALALAAEAGDAHPFAVKFRLLTAGRWPLGIVGRSCFVF